MVCRFLSATALMMLVYSFVHGQEDQWPQFRGPNASGIALLQNVPSEFGPDQNVKWKLAVLSGHSSPAVWGERLFLTGVDIENKNLQTWCINAIDGSVNWQRGVDVEQIEDGHPDFCPASSSPATDGSRVVAYFGSFGLVCYDNEGEQLWEFPLPFPRTFSGTASSPVIAGDKVLFCRGCDRDHCLIAINKESGEEVWRTRLPGRFRSSSSCAATPVVSGDQVIVHDMASVRSYSLDTGERTWYYRCQTTATSTPVLHGDRLLVSTWHQIGDESHLEEYPDFVTLKEENDRDLDGTIDESEFPADLMVFDRPEGNDAEKSGAYLRFGRIDRNNDEAIDEDEWNAQLERAARMRETLKPHGLLSIPITQSGRISQDDVEYLESEAIPEVPSPVVYDDRIFLMKNGGILSCLDLSTGELIDRQRFGPSGTHYASPIVHDGKLIQASGNGRITVLDIRGDVPLVLAENEFGESFYATPAIANNTLYVRSESTLYAFSNSK